MIRSLLLVAILAGAVAPTAAEAQIRLDLNIPTLKLVVHDGDQVLQTYPVAVGQPGYDTPTGSYKISHAEWNPWWRPPTHREWARNERVTPPGPNNPMGRVKLFFMPLYFIHGTPDGQSIGTPASRGCVRMRNSDVIELAKLLHRHAAPNVSSAEIDRILARPSQTRHVNFRDQIEVVIRYDPVVVEKGEIYAFPDIYNRNAIHPEGVYQALVSAGYDVSNVDHADVRRFVDGARGKKVPVIAKLDDVFGSALALAGD
jgi:murein L,D-transpeptidase YcbB/YkuD